VARFLLKNSGWKPPPDRLVEIMNEHKKLVIVYPHTSHYDGLLMILYKKAYPDFGRHIKFLIRPDLTEIPLLGKFLISNGAIPSTFIQIKNGGRTKEIINYLNTKDEYKFLISPKGTIRKSEWKTGYYYITKGTGSYILALGLNYKTGEIEYNDPYPLKGDDKDFPSEENLRNILQSQLKNIPQRTPWNVEY
jgi:1-acyl-sn-glycerol-3-phosphate acyltransferase